MKSIVTFLFLAFISNETFAQKANIVKVQGEAQTEWNQRIENMEQAEKRAIDLASVNALEKAFGRMIVQGNSTYIQNINSGEKTETKSVFNTISNTSVRGEIIEILDKKITRIPYKTNINGTKEDRIDIKCEIYIRAKEIRETLVNFIANTLSKADKTFITTSFQDGSDFFMSFKSPQTGYLCIYMEDPKNAFRILPYSHAGANEENGEHITADKDYILFDDKLKDINAYQIDTYRLLADTDQDLYRVYVIFSKMPLSKPILQEANAAGRLSADKTREGYRLPKSMLSMDFQKWIVNYLSTNDQIQIQRIDITVSKPKQ